MTGVSFFATGCNGPICLAKDLVKYYYVIYVVAVRVQILALEFWAQYHTNSLSIIHLSIHVSMLDLETQSMSACKLQFYPAIPLINMLTGLVCNYCHPASRDFPRRVMVQIPKIVRHPIHNWQMSAMPWERYSWIKHIICNCYISHTFQIWQITNQSTRNVIILPDTFTYPMPFPHILLLFRINYHVQCFLAIVKYWRRTKRVVKEKYNFSILFSHRQQLLAVIWLSEESKSRH